MDRKRAALSIALKYNYAKVNDMPRTAGGEDSAVHQLNVVRIKTIIQAIPMPDSERPAFNPEGFATLALAQHEFERHGYYLFPIPREHAEGLVTAPVVQRLHTTIKKRGFANVASHVVVTFSGYRNDEREVYAIPEA